MFQLPIARKINVNEIFHDEITKIYTNELTDPHYRGYLRQIREDVRNLCYIIDELGVESAEQQGLKKSITVSDKLMRLMEPQILYFLKDSQSNGGMGEVIGFIKVGYKSLYVNDEEGKSHYLKPLCVLDFYVRQKFQRQGCGKKIFDYMIKDLNASPHEIAIDAPSLKMIEFMKKHYHIDKLIKQCCNFSISQNFFTKMPKHEFNGKCMKVDI